MKLNRILTAAAFATLPIFTSAATLIIPAAGTGAGANDSRWQTELTLHNASSRAIPVTLYFHDANGRTAPASVEIAARSTRSIDDVVKTTFAREQATGALVLEVADTDARRLAVASRTFNRSDAGDFGQDIPAVRATDAADAGDVAVLVAPSSATDARFNFGLFAVTDTTVRWELIRANGTLAATREQAYRAGVQLQYVNGIQSFLGAAAQDDDTLHATVSSGSAVFYGSTVDNRTGDPTYGPSILTNDEIRLAFSGIDLDENGTVDVADLDRDGVTDRPIEIIASLFPSFFRIVAAGEHGEAVTYELISSAADALFVDANGTLQVAATADLRGTSSDLKIRATAGGSSSILTIPVTFK